MRLLSQQVTDHVLNTQETPDIIVTSCYKGMRSLKYPEYYGKLLFSSELSDPPLAHLSARDHIKRRIRMLRQSNQVVKEPNNLQFQSVLTQFTGNHPRKNFPQRDTGPGK